MMAWETQWAQRGLLLALLLGALAVRLVGLELRDLWYDEQITLIDSQGIEVPMAVLPGAAFSSADLWSGAGILEVARNSSIHDQPLYVSLIHLWGNRRMPTEWTLRLPSAILGAAAAPLLASLGYELVGRWPGLLAGLLLAVSPLHVHYSQEARVYPAAVFMLVLTVWIGFRLQPSSSRGAFVSWGVSAALVAGLHLLAGVALLPILGCLIGRSGLKTRLPYALLGALSVGLLLLPLGYFQSWATAHRDSGLGFQALSAQPGSWARPSSFVNVATGVGTTVTRLVGIEYFPLGLRGRHVAALSMPLFAWALAAARSLPSKETRALLIGGALLPVGLSALLSLAYGHTVPLQDRYSAWSLPFIALLLAHAVWIARGWVRELAGRGPPRAVGGIPGR